MIRYILARPRLSTAIVIGIASWFVIPGEYRATTRALACWDMATAVYLLAIGWMMARTSLKGIRRNAAALDQGGASILAFTTITAIASLAAIILELAGAKDMHGAIKGEHIALVALTVVLSWSFLHSMYALHYAHEFYSDGSDGQIGGLEFPGGSKTPDYWDFVYFSFIIGTACATADINIESPVMRRTATMHCVLSFFFNTTILALMINIGAGLF